MPGGRAVLLGLVLLAGCSANEPIPKLETAAAAQQGASKGQSIPLETIDVGQSRRTISFQQTAAHRALASCPEGEVFVPPQPINLTATPVDLGPERASREAVADNVSYVGGWHITSDEPNFGGLSGLDILEDGNLLAVSDAGAFVQINMSERTPSGDGTISYMRGPNGRLLEGKRSNDAEGLHVEAGLAAVSFERDHRIAVFNLDDCGAAARGVSASVGGVVSETGEPSPNGLPEDLPDNGGLEALTLDGETFLTGLEAGERSGTPLFRLSPYFRQFYAAGSLKTPSGMKLTGLDTAASDKFALFRRYLPLFGNTIEVRRYGSLTGEGEQLLRLERPLIADNFEGLATMQLEDDTTRIYIISDDNFSARQRTLLMAFDIAPDTVPN